ncbi:MAG: DNA repair protein [Candidatus Rokubacteria bacterium GWC2_70_16]|nr:MAG: DNA repair protein [Candidatus Rokubacteria bacterium GWC2_70_16]OGL13803.1 MAG: DNA repair protein [Candidatus Rokubacteria bacterium RIFCSPLOWO2_12_FULL_71_19]
MTPAPFGTDPPRGWWAAALPFVRWFPMGGATVRADLVAGITVALVLVPQSLAYAQLAGLPPYYGLYAAFVPVMVAALWGSSSQLATGPVAMVSLLTGSVLAPLAAVGSAQLAGLAILLALLVGLVEMILGVCRLGAIVNFLSHPVIVGFTNAAAIIIVLSQASKLLGVSMGRSERFFLDVWGVAQQIGDTHVPTLVMGVSALALMWLLRRYLPNAPGVLIVVALATAASWYGGFGQTRSEPIDRLVAPDVRTIALEFDREEARVSGLRKQIDGRLAELKALERARADGGQHGIALRYQVELLRLEVKDAERENRIRQRALRNFVLARAPGAGPAGDRYDVWREGAKDADPDSRRWRVSGISNGRVKLVGGGEVVGEIPRGLPRVALPKIDWETVQLLWASTLVITMVGFMEAVSIGKAMAVRTGERIDPNRELIGQGLANILGSFTQSYPVSGSFSRSAVNLSAGARTGMASVFTGMIVLLTLLFLTPLLYHMPQAVLSAVIVMAVGGLVNAAAMKHAWQAQKHDGIAAWVTFLATLGFAPHLDTGVLVGAGVAIVLYLYRRMKPRVAILGRHPDGTLRDARLHGLPTGEHATAVRFDGSLYFANVSYFEDAILEAVAQAPRAKHLLVVGDGINEVDASGAEAIRHLSRRLRETGVTLVFSGLKHQVVAVVERTGLSAEIGAENFFRTEDAALSAIYGAVADQSVDAQFRPPHPAAPP